MPSAGTMIDETLGLLQSWSLDEEQSTTLAAPVNVGDYSFTVTSARGIATGISPGIIEIDRELFYCDSVNGTTVTVVPWGRGYKNTVQVAHAAGARVVSQPTFPRAKTLDAMNEVMDRVFPMVYAIRQIEQTTTQPQFTYSLPANTQRVLGVKWQNTGPEQYWSNIRRWRQSPGGGTYYGDKGITVDVLDGMQAGRPIQFIYSTKPDPMIDETDDFVVTTGLNLGLRDVICLGAAATLTTSQELSRLQVSAIEQQNRSQLVAPSAGLTASRYLGQEFQTRLMEERRSLQILYPPRITRSWS